MGISLERQRAICRCLRCPQQIFAADLVIRRQRHIFHAVGWQRALEITAVARVCRCVRQARYCRQWSGEDLCAGATVRTSFITLGTVDKPTHQTLGVCPFHGAVSRCSFGCIVAAHCGDDAPNKGYSPPLPTSRVVSSVPRVGVAQVG